MKNEFKYKLNATETEEIKKFCNSVDYCSAEQLIGWTPMFFKSRICFFYLYDESGIKSFCKINERLGSANIILGPVCCEREIMVLSLNEIINYYKKKRYYYLGIQMYYKSGFDTDYIEYLLNREHDIKYIFDPENTQTSIEIDLENSIDEIWESFSAGHKRCVKKAVKLGVTVDEIRNENELKSFVDVCSRMCDSRHLIDKSFPSDNITEIYNFLVRNNRGIILGVKDKDGILLGGIILIYQGISVRILKGGSDPDRRDVPITHILVFDAIKRCKDANFKYLDMWGYNHLVDEKHQIFKINIFKRGFGGYYTFFAKKMNINLIPKGYYIYMFLLFIKKVLTKTHLLKSS